MILPIFLKKGDKLHVGHKNRKLLYIKIYLEWNINFFFPTPGGITFQKWLKYIQTAVKFT